MEFLINLRYSTVLQYNRNFLINMFYNILGVLFLIKGRNYFTGNFYLLFVIYSDSNLTQNQTLTLKPNPNLFLSGV